MATQRAWRKLGQDIGCGALYLAAGSVWRPLYQTSKNYGYDNFLSSAFPKSIAAQWAWRKSGQDVGWVSLARVWPLLYSSLLLLVRLFLKGSFFCNFLWLPRGPGGSQDRTFLYLAAGHMAPPLLSSPLPQVKPPPVCFPGHAPVCFPTQA